MRGMPSIGDIGNDIAHALYEFRVPVAIASVGLVLLAAVVARRLGWVQDARRHPGRTGAILVCALAVMAPVGWYLGSPIFIRTSLVEAEPGAGYGGAGPAASATGFAPTFTTQPPAAVPSTEIAPSAAATPVAPVTIATGEFSGTDDFHFGRGTASLIQLAPGRYHLRLDALSVRNGPDLYVYLSADPDGYADDALELGTLKATDGSFGYDLPDGVDPARFKSALIWCKQFSHLFAVATFGG